VSGSFNEEGQLELADGRILLCVGKKRSGKSKLALLLFQSYPFDKIVLDIAGDDGPVGPDVIPLRGDVETLPRRWPEGLRDEGKPMTLSYIPDAGSPTSAEDMDAVVGLALSHGRHLKDRGRGGCALLIHEIGVLAPAHRTQPNMRRALMHNRHNGLTLIMCGPRPQVVDPLVVQQSDVVYTFELMNPDDRERLAKSMGWSPRDFDAAVEDLGPHEYLRYDANELKPAEGQLDRRLIHCPALPADVVRSVEPPAPKGRPQP
jgi:hypothetical protein